MLKKNQLLEETQWVENGKSLKFPLQREQDNTGEENPEGDNMANLPKFNKNLFIGILLIIIFILLGIFGCVSMTGGKGNPLCPDCNETPTTTPKPTLTPTPDTNTDDPTPTPEGYIPTPTPTPTPIDSCSTYNAETCLAWATTENKPHYGMATSLDDCIYNVGDSYCNDIFQSWVELSDYDPAPECCCIWKCSGE